MLAICLSLALVACGNSKDSSTQTEAQTPEQPQSQTSAETAGAEQTIVENQKETNDSKVLVAYFAFSENIGDTSSMDVDAITLPA